MQAKPGRYEALALCTGNNKAKWKCSSSTSTLHAATFLEEDISCGPEVMRFNLGPTTGPYSAAERRFGDPNARRKGEIFEVIIRPLRASEVFPGKYDVIKLSHRRGIAL